MNISSIGVQRILPQSGISGQSNPAPEPESTTGENTAATPSAPAAAGTGQIVDKTV